MILILTSKDDATADFVADRLKRSQYLRLDSDDLPAAARIESTEHSAAIVVRGRKFFPPDFSGVWYRRPKAIIFAGAGDQGERRHASAEYTSALEGFLALIPEERWINHPTRNVRAGHKLEQVQRAKRFGFRVPRTLITQNPHQLKRFWAVCGGSVIVKPLSNGYIERASPAQDSLIYTNQLRREDLDQSVEIQRCPSLFQERVQKTADIRITVVDRHVQAVELYASDNGRQRLDIRRDNMVDVQYHPTKLPRPLTDRIHRLMRSYNLRFAAIDLLRDEAGKYVFLEVNPNGQWAWLDMAGASNTRDQLIRSLRPV